jgi:hypothetical protein
MSFPCLGRGKVNLYSPKCLEEAFCELLLCRVLGSSAILACFATIGGYAPVGSAGKGVANMDANAASDVPQWHVVGDWFDVCRCDIPCPCAFAQAPTDNWCEGVMAYHVREGNYGDVRLDGLSLIALTFFEGNAWAGEAEVSLGLFIDERADERQREALQMIFGGQAGGWQAEFAELIGELRGIEFVPIEFEVADDLAYWRATIPGKVEAASEALTGPTTPEGQRVQLLNPPGSEVGPGQVATWGRATADRVEGFGFKWEWDGKSSKHIPFDWTGP